VGGGGGGRGAAVAIGINPPSEVKKRSKPKQGSPVRPARQMASNRLLGLFAGPLKPTAWASLPAGLGVAAWGEPMGGCRVTVWPVSTETVAGVTQSE
jgi:hypothetical protein